MTPRGPRPLTLNTWEAVYFDHSLERLAPLVDAARRVGMERFVLDDGWFTGRTDDRRALGDWDVDSRAVAGRPLPLIDACARRRHAVRAVGRARDGQRRLRPRPTRIRSGCSTPADSVSWRCQQVLDLAHPDAWAYVFGKLDALLREYPIA